MIRQQKIKIHWLIFTIYFVIMSVGLPLHKHYCLGNLKKVQLFIKPESCHSSEHKEAISVCCSEKHDNEKGKTCSTKEGKCCSDKLEFYKIDITSIIVTSEKSKTSFNPVFVFNSNAFYFFPKNFDIDRYIKKSYNHPLKIPDLRAKLALYQQFIC